MPKHKPPPINIDRSIETPKTLQPHVHSPQLFDWEEWLPYLEEMDGTVIQKKELIETLWTVILGFVDLGWEIGADPKALGLQSSGSQPSGSQLSGSHPCGQNLDLSAVLRAAVLQSEITEQTRITQQNPKEGV